jgi:type I restriction enzyme, S subunit
VSELPLGWVGATLGEITSIISGSTPKTGSPEYWGGDIAWITPDDLSRDRSKTITRGARSLTEAGYASCSTTLMPPGSVLYSSRAPIGYAAVAGAPVCTNQGFKSFVPTSAITSDFLYWFLVHATPEIRKLGSGTTFPELSKAKAREVPIELPPLNEQRRIVAAIEEHLSRLDAADASLAAALRRLDGLRAASLAAAVNGSWPEIPLSELILSLRNGVFVSRPAADPPGTAIFRISAVRPLELNVDDVRYASIDAPDYLVSEGDLLFTRYSGNPDLVGACALVPKLPRPTLHPDKLIRVVVDRSKVEPGFVQIACATGRSRDEIRVRRKTTAGQVGIAGGQLKSVPVPVPPLEEQRRIVQEVEERLSRIDAMRASIERAQRRSATLRAAILERAFRGGLVPQDPADEPAETLLARIRARQDLGSKQASR